MQATLQRKFKLGFIAAVIVVISSGLCIRLLGKAALFHHLERDHLGMVMQASNALGLALDGGRSAASVSKDELLANIRQARALAVQATSELFPIEQLAFEWIGFAEILQQPREVIGVATRIEQALVAAPGSLLTPDVAQQVKPDLALMRQASDRFGPLVAEATRFIRSTAIVLTVVPLAMLLAIFHLIRAATLKPIGQVVQAAERIAQGNLSGPALPRRPDEVGQLAQAIDTMRTRLTALVGQVRDRSAAVDLAIGEVTQGGSDLSARTERQAATLQQTAGRIRELRSAIQSSAAQVGEAEAVAAQARALAAQGGAAVQRAVDGMDRVLASSRRIAEINSVVDGIAFQTNILALNAAVEAAQAGEMGRGFAVVAGEVRGLAQRSANAAKEIAALIDDTVAKVQAGAEEVHATGEAIRQVVTTAEQVSVLTTEVAQHLAAQRASVTDIDAAMAELDAATQQNAALAEQSAASADSVRTQSAALVAAVDQFSVA